VLRAGNVLPLHPQGIDRTGLKSPSERGDADGLRRAATAAARAISAWHGSPAEQRRRSEWLATGLPHNSNHLFARLPFGDAIRLAALVGAGRMTWAEVNAALDTRIKLAVAMHRSRRDARHPDSWEAARQAREDDIWARYHAKCDALFAEDTAGDAADPWNRDALRDRERMLERLRCERDQALTALKQGMGAPLRSGIARIQITPSESAALRKLDASGFAASAGMEEAIQSLASPLAAVGLSAASAAVPAGRT
jgi:hypothetical protein